MIEIINIKRYLKVNKGRRIRIIQYSSRNRLDKYVGTVLNVYNNIFTVILLDGCVKSFSYADILTKNIKIYI